MTESRWYQDVSSVRRLRVFTVVYVQDDLLEWEIKSTASRSSHS